MADMCNVHYGDTKADKDAHMYCPGKVLCFVELPNGKHQVIVDCCEFNFHRKIMFSTSWKKEYIYENTLPRKPAIYSIDVKCIVCTGLMIPKSQEYTEY